MIELIIVALLARRLAGRARDKGQTGWWGGAAVLGWIVGQFFGFVIGTLLGLEGVSIYPVALIGGLLGLGAAFFVVNNLPNETEPGMAVPAEPPSDAPAPNVPPPTSPSPSSPPGD